MNPNLKKKKKKKFGGGWGGMEVNFLKESKSKKTFFGGEGEGEEDGWLCGFGAGLSEYF